MIDKKVCDIFEFLKSNRQYNKSVQKLSYEQTILPWSTQKDKIVSLLHHIANTQSQPKIDKLALFFKEINRNSDNLVSFEKFANALSTEKIENPKYENIFNNMLNKDGWGNKTAALFVKSLYHIHNGEYGDQIKIWDDAPKTITNENRFYLPVDSVIEFIFSGLNLNIRNDFKGINAFLKDNYSVVEIEIWDDLWFWGFITQKSNNAPRKSEWNENKYWALLHTSKDENTILEIKKKAIEFIRLLK